MLGALALAALAVAGAGLAVYGLARTQALAAEALAAQRRIEAYGALSSRMNEWMLGWLAPNGPTPDPSQLRAAIEAIEALVASDVAAAPSETEAEMRVRGAVTPARIRALVDRLEEQLAGKRPGSPEWDMAAYNAAQVPALAAAQAGQETRRRDEAMAAMDVLRRRLHRLAIAVGLAAPLALAGLWLWTLRPLFRRLTSATAAAEALAAGAPGLRGHDELGLLLARVRLAAARVARDRARLNATVAERTAELSRANLRLSRADAERRRFFADVGHELRTPLTVILGEAELGARHSDPALQASFATIRGRALRLTRRIEDLLRVARSESGQLELERAALDLAVAADAALADAAPLLARAGVTARRAEMPELPVTGDAEWLRQVIGGILENATKYAGRGATVTIAGRAGGGRAVVEIADDGPGMPAARLGAAFDRFARGEGAAAPGFGVGLALARWVVEAHGGDLRAEAPAAGGLRLVMTLPLAGTEAA
ncbi:sensor histidine kinase KdpD [Amaricoccus sp.]|uniref:sensor histidine kinase n=1 Tax=Amaricoccus sp. TaxID=1872485 RepID=UPI001B52D2BE|nr:HAMP domain-containing sensor histidine kinase [Amaricoccus sp.]MBP7001119.1 HAMP domain-containing histidine kinase [Amaricoccus sp.]